MQRIVTAVFVLLIIAGILIIVYLWRQEREFYLLRGVEGELYGALTEWHKTHKEPLPDLATMREYGIDCGLPLERFHNGVEYSGGSVGIGYDPDVAWGSRRVIMVVFYVGRIQLLWAMRADLSEFDPTLERLESWQVDHPDARYYVLRR